MLTELQSLKGEAFDKDYVTQQLTAHQQTLALQISYANGGEDAGLKAVAAKLVPVVQRHLTMLKTMQATD
jgi:putative membrane protein